MKEPQNSMDEAQFEDLDLSESDEKAKEIINRSIKQLDRDETRRQELREKHKNLVDRIKAMAREHLLQLPEGSTKVKAGQLVFVCANSDLNRRVAMDALFGDKKPHFDTYFGRLVDQNNEVIDDKYSVGELMEAFCVAGMTGTSYRASREALKEYALRNRSNFLIDRVNKVIPEWDGEERIEGEFVRLFKCFDTELNRMVSRVWWLSLYNRIMDPGCLAEIVVALFGCQGAGKTEFYRRINCTLLGNDKAAVANFDPSANQNEQLRRITGTSAIVQIPEMVGFNRGDLNKLKDFITKRVDIFDFKYEGTVQQARQWILAMDGNKYEGLQRDDTGNRRFYPLFVGQKEDEDGKPAWEHQFKVDFSGFEERVWQMFAECKAWMQAHGTAAYERLVRDCGVAVGEFSDLEIQRGRGTIADDDLDVWVPEGLIRVTKHKLVSGSRNCLRTGRYIYSADLANEIREAGFLGHINMRKLRSKMGEYGADLSKSRDLINNKSAYFFPDGCVLPGDIMEDDGNLSSVEAF